MSFRNLWRTNDQRGVFYKGTALAAKWGTIAAVGLGYITTALGDQISASHMKGKTTEQACAAAFTKANVTATPEMIQGCAFEKQRSIDGEKRGHRFARLGTTGVLAVLVPVWIVAGRAAKRREEEAEQQIRHDNHLSSLGL